MSTNAPVSMRIYCICGQKMRVSEEMFGRNGKCVACRQKIRIPRQDEIEPGTRELYLKDHPEFLRKTRRAPVDWSGVGTPMDDDPDAGEAGERLSTVPIDVLEPLQAIVALERQAVQRLEALKSLEVAGIVKTERAELRAHRVRLEDARNALEDYLRQRLMEVAIELTNTNEKLAQADLAVRVGESDFVAYVKQVRKLRRRRDLLERRQVNLRGWLVLRDPGVAGGMIEDPAFEQIPSPETAWSLPPDPDIQDPAVPYYIGRLREAFHERERAQHRLDAATAEGGTLRDACKGELTRIGMAIDFYRDRLERAAADAAADRQALHAQLELLRGRLQIGEIRRDVFDASERALKEERDHLRKYEQQAARAIQARSARELPATGSASGSLLPRWAQGLTFGTDAWLAWGSAVALLFAVVLPGLGGLSPLAVWMQSGGDTPWLHWGLSGPLAAAFLFTLAAMVPVRAVRGLLFCGLWLGLTLATTVFLRMLWEHPGRVGALLHEGGLTSPALLVHIGALVALLVAAGMCLYPVRGLRFGAFVTALLAAAGIAVLTVTAGPPSTAFTAEEPPGTATQPAPVTPPTPAPDTPPVAESVPEETILVPAPAEALDEAATETEETIAEADPATEDLQPFPPLEAAFEIEWTGFVAGEGGVEPRFLILLHDPVNGVERVWCEVGDDLYGDWRVAEFDPSRQALTLQAEDELLIIRRNERHPLPGVD